MNEQFKIKLTDNTPDNAPTIIKAVNIACEAGTRLETLDSMLGALHRLTFTLLEDCEDCNPEQLTERLEQILAMVETMKDSCLPIITGQVDEVVKTFQSDFKLWQGMQIVYPPNTQPAEVVDPEGEQADKAPGENNLTELMP